MSTTIDANNITLPGILSAGGVRGKVTLSPVDYAILTTDFLVVLTVTGKTATLPLAVSVPGQLFMVKLTATGTGTVAASGSDKIDGASSYSLSAAQKVVAVISDGVSNWDIVSQN